MIKKILLLVTLSAVLLLSACSLAKSEESAAAQVEDRLMGVYIIDQDTDGNLYDMEGWIRDGMENYDAGSINIDMPRMIFPAVYVQEEHRYLFPGLKGYALFVAEARDSDGAYPYHTTCSDLQEVHVKYHTVDAGVTEEESPSKDGYTNYEIEGTLYRGDEISEGRYWRLLNVFQKPDGTVYLDGTGDAFGSSGAITLEEKCTQTVNGEKIEKGTTKVSVTIEEAKEADSGVLYWYGEKGELLMTQPLDLEQVTELTWQEKAAWVVYEETFGEEVAYTLYEKGTEDAPTMLTIMTINEDGIGEVKTVEIK